MKLWNRFFPPASKDPRPKPEPGSSGVKKPPVQRLKNSSRITPKSSIEPKTGLGFIAMIIKPAAKIADIKSTWLNASALEGKILTEVQSLAGSPNNQTLNTTHLNQLIEQYVRHLKKSDKSIESCLQLMKLRESILDTLSTTGHSQAQSSLQETANHIGQMAFTFIPEHIAPEYTELLVQLYSDNALAQSDAYLKLLHAIGDTSSNFHDENQQQLFKNTCHNLALSAVQPQQGRELKISISPESEQQCRRGKDQLYTESWREIHEAWQKKSELVASELSRKDFVRSDVSFSHEGRKLFDFEQVKAQCRHEEAQGSTAIREARIEDEVVSTLNRDELSTEQQMHVMNFLNQTEHNIMVESLQNEVITKWPDLGFLQGVNMQNTIDVDIHGDEVLMTFSIDATPELAMNTNNIIQYSPPSALKMTRTIRIKRGAPPEYGAIKTALTLGPGHQI